MGVVGTEGHLNMDSFRSDAILRCEQFFPTPPPPPSLEHCLVVTACTDSVLGNESCMSDGLCHMQKDKRDLFHSNHL